MDDVTKHQLYIAPSIGKLHAMIKLLMNRYIIREFFFRKILTLKYFFVVISFFFKRKCFGKKIHHPWTQILGFGEFFVNFHILLQNICQLTLNLRVDAMSIK
jgi:hypothetical protein